MLYRLNVKKILTRNKNQIKSVLKKIYETKQSQEKTAQIIRTEKLFYINMFFRFAFLTLKIINLALNFFSL